MTRINCGIPPKELSREHLLAEHRELKRIPNVVKKRVLATPHKIDPLGFKKNPIPAQFCLGTGHVRFFYNKIKYLHKRYKELYRECLIRGYNVTDFLDSFDSFNKPPLIFLYNDYSPTAQDMEIVRQRIKERS